MPDTAHWTERQLTYEEAIAFAESRAWEHLEAWERALFQLGQERLCMPFNEFQKATQELLGRPVWTHEFADGAALLAEYRGERPARTFEDVLALIPADKRVVIVTGEGA